MAQDAFFYVGQKALIQNAEREVLILFSENGDGLDFPGGRLQQSETDLSASLQREVTEETKLTIEVHEPFFTWLNDWESPTIKKGQIFLVGYRCKYVSGTVKTSNEHTMYKWVTKQSYKDLPYKNNYSDALEEYFKLV